MKSTRVSPTVISNLVICECELILKKNKTYFQYAILSFIQLPLPGKIYYIYYDNYNVDE